MSISDRSAPVLRNLGTLFNHGRLSGTGYLSILPVDQGVEHPAGSAFAPNPLYFDSENVVRLAIEGGCSAVTSEHPIDLARYQVANCHMGRAGLINSGGP